jgi:hypothetical protein
VKTSVSVEVLANFVGGVVSLTIQNSMPGGVLELR